MKKQVEIISYINLYIANNRNDSKKMELARGYLTSKVNSILSKDSKKSDFITKVLSIPVLFSLF